MFEGLDNPIDLERARLVLTCLDFTDLSESRFPLDIADLCARAQTPYGHVAAVCVQPQFVGPAAIYLAGQPVRVATLVNAPDGDGDRDSVVSEVEQAIAEGASEIDLVLPFGQIADNRDIAYDIVAAVRRAAGKALLTVILQTDRLGDERVDAATQVAMDGGADFIKTTTAPVPVAAVTEASRIILSDIADHGGDIGFNPGNGVRSLQDAIVMLDLVSEYLGIDWATPRTFRISSSGLLDKLLGLLEESGVPATAEGITP